MIVLHCIRRCFSCHMSVGEIVRKWGSVAQALVDRTGSGHLPWIRITTVPVARHQAAGACSPTDQKTLPVVNRTRAGIKVPETQPQLLVLKQVTAPRQPLAGFKVRIFVGKVEHEGAKLVQASFAKHPPHPKLVLQSPKKQATHKIQILRSFLIPPRHLQDKNITYPPRHLRNRFSWVLKIRRQLPRRRCWSWYRKSRLPHHLLRWHLQWNVGGMWWGGSTGW